MAKSNYRSSSSSLMTSNKYLAVHPILFFLCSAFRQMPGSILTSPWHEKCHWSGFILRWCSPSSVLRSIKDWSLQDASTRLLTRSALPSSPTESERCCFCCTFLLINPLVMGARPSSSWMLAPWTMPILKSHRERCHNAARSRHSKGELPFTLLPPCCLLFRGNLLCFYLTDTPMASVM